MLSYHLHKYENGYYGNHDLVASLSEQGQKRFITYFIAS